MKKIKIAGGIICLVIAMLPLQSIASNDSIPKNLIDHATIESAEAEVMLKRLNEIEQLDKSDLSLSEKKNLRKEVRTMKHQLAANGNGGVYISVGAAIIIVLLLIIIF